MKNLDGDGSSAHGELTTGASPLKSGGEQSIDPTVSTELQRLKEDDDGSQADEILLRELLAEEKRCTGSLLKIWIRTGEVLLARRKKCALNHGTWRPWLKAHTTYSHDSARIYMGIAKNKERILALPKDEPVRLLSDAYILATEDDPETREELLQESKDTGKSVRVIVNKRKKQELVVKPPAQRSRNLRQAAAQNFYWWWNRNNDGRTTLRDTSNGWIRCRSPKGKPRKRLVKRRSCYVKSRCLGRLRRSQPTIQMCRSRNRRPTTKRQTSILLKC